MLNETFDPIKLIDMWFTSGRQIISYVIQQMKRKALVRIAVNQQKRVFFDMSNTILFLK